jgi:hypothetical protein
MGPPSLRLEAFVEDRLRPEMSEVIGPVDPASSGAASWSRAPSRSGVS